MVGQNLIFNLIIMDKPLDPEFWKKKKLEELNELEWEALCDCCGKCCLCKVTMGNEVLFLNVTCPNLSLPSCRCHIYNHRVSNECLKVDLQLVQNEPENLPDTCAYKLLSQGKDLPDWHPLVAGSPDSVVRMGKGLEISKLIPGDRLQRGTLEYNRLLSETFPIEIVKLK